MNYVGIDWAYGRAAWCARSESGAIDGEGLIAADEDGLARLALKLGPEVRGCVEMMSGAIWVKDQLERAGWSVEVAHARKVRDIAPLACKTDKVDARVLAELCRRDLVPAVWVASQADRAIRERLRRRAHLVKSSAPRRATGSSGCSRSSACESRLPACDSPVPWSCSSIAACRRSGAIRSPSIWPRSKSSTEGSPRSTTSSPRSLAQTRGPSCCRRSPASGF